uniref:Prolactin regulatory element-binding protein n=1 Tax=Oncorhynchus tshawytscha TaxID=74940 RepID=A0AAZ3SRZ6_ONCTS
MGKRRMPDLYRAPFPLYTIKVDPKTGWVITAGGGGGSKTGIKNAVHFLGLELVGDQHCATLVHSHDTDTRATMNLAIGGDVIAAGQDGRCSLMRFRQHQPRGKAAAKDAGGGSEQGAARRRAGKGGKGSEGAAARGNVSEMNDNTTQISVDTFGEVQSDLNPQDPLQKCVRFSPDLSLLLTGGTDGHIRVWEYPSLKEKLDFKAHEGEIEDLDISPNNKHIPLSPTNFHIPCYITDIWFGKVEDQKDTLRLYTVQIPHKRDRKPPQCYLSKWDGQNFLPMLTNPCGTEVISTLAVSDSGTFLGLGTVTGSVAIYVAFSLQKLYYVQESHGIVVTDLAFLPDTPKGQSLKGNNEAAMLSVAVDSRCQMHTVRNRSKWFELVALI